MDGASATLHHTSKFHAHVKIISADCTLMNCMIYRDTITLKTMKPDLTEVLKQVLKLVITVKSSLMLKLVNACLFQRFCEQMVADNYTITSSTARRRDNCNKTKCSRRFLLFKANYGTF